MTLPFTFQEWKSKTNRFSGVRSAQLRELDRVLNQYLNNNPEYSVARLKDTFDNWYNKHVKEAHNRRRNTGNIIATLKTYLERPPPAPPRSPAPHASTTTTTTSGNHDAVVAELAAKRKPRTLPSKAVSSPSNLVTVNDSAGDPYRIYIQKHGTDCGPTCVAQMVLLLTNKEVEPSHCLHRMAPEQAARERVNNPTQAIMQSRGDAADANVRRATRDGTDIASFVSALNPQIKDDGWQSAFVTNISSFRVLLEHLSKGPVILRLTWWNATRRDYSGPGHFVVVAPTPGSGVIIDPWYGLQTAYDIARFPEYLAIGAQRSRKRSEQIAGRFTGQAITARPLP